MPLQVTNWDEYFENSRSRQVKDAKWLPLPNRHDGLSYNLLWAEPDAAEIFAAWVLILEVASKCHPRGTLVASARHGGAGKPLSTRDLSTITRAPGAIFERAIPFLVTLGWLTGSADERRPGTTQVPPKCQEGGIERRKELKELKHGALDKTPDAPISSKPRKTKTDKPSAAFEGAWDEYWRGPLKRTPNPKQAAWLAWRARVRAGIAKADLVTATAGYAAYVIRERTEPRFIKQAQTFYGPGGHWQEFAGGAPTATGADPRDRHRVSDVNAAWVAAVEEDNWRREERERKSLPQVECEVCGKPYPTRKAKPPHVCYHCSGERRRAERLREKASLEVQEAERCYGFSENTP